MGVALPYWRDDPPNNFTHTIVMDMNDYDLAQEYQFKVDISDGMWGGQMWAYSVTEKFRPNQNGTYTNVDGTLTVNNGVATWVVNDKDAFVANDYGDIDENGVQKKFVNVYQNPGLFPNTFCQMGYYTATRKDINNSCKLYVWQEDRGNNASCYSTGCMEGSTATIIRVEGLTYNDLSKSPFDDDVRVEYSGGNLTQKAQNGVVEVTFSPGTGTQNIVIYSDKGGRDWKAEGCFTAFSVTNDCGDLCEETKTDVAGKGTGITGNFRLCEQTGNNVDRQKCLDCVGGTTLGGQQTGMWTAIGCIPTNAQGIITTIIQLGLGIGGGVTLLLILAGAFRLSVAQGDPKQAEEAKEQITSAVIGLLFIIFSITMLRFIGVQVLNIPGFGVN